MLKNTKQTLRQDLQQNRETLINVTRIKEIMKLYFLLLLLVIVVDDGMSLQTNGISVWYNPVLSKDCWCRMDQWFTQFLDHFNPTDMRTWQQRYFVNGEYYKLGGPIFLMISGEETATTIWMEQGQWIEYAKEFNALCFLLEHRFYGKSRPTSDLSVKNLLFLSSEQALADLAYFIQDMNACYKLPTDSKWIAFGGSYSGSLAAWLRLKYPRLVHGAVSTSSALLAQIDFQEYYVIVEDALRQNSKACVDAIAEANKQFHVLLHHPIGQQRIVKQFLLCDPIDPGHTKPNDISNLYQLIMYNLGEIVQYNGDNRDNMAIADMGIDDACDVMTDETLGIAIDRLAYLTKKILHASRTDCLDYVYDNMIRKFRNVTWMNDEGEEGGGSRQWMYQMCTEFGFFQTSTARPNLFSETFPVNFFLQQCTDTFGPKFDEHLLNAAVNRTNMWYGALNLKTTNVVFVHGSIDPWHVLGITSSTNPQMPAILINGTAHCASMYATSPNDPPELKAARQQVGNFIQQWLNQEQHLHRT